MSKFQIAISIPKNESPIAHREQVLLTGSCFTEHIGKRLEQIKMAAMINPNGILFNPLSVARALQSYIDEQVYNRNDLFLQDEIWHCWDFHSRFSHTDPEQALRQMNDSVREAAQFIRQTDRLIITLGSAYQYYLKQGNTPVANCHRAPGTWFEKHLLSIETITETLGNVLSNLQKIRPELSIILTISPVRHLRDGIVENNRSKARLIEAVHLLTESVPSCSYFPAYELVIDVLRDYRFYDIDMAHPNYAATQFVWEQFSNTYFDADMQQLAGQLQDIATALNHRPRFPDTSAHKNFLKSYREKVERLARDYPYINFDQERAYFNT